MMRLYPKKLRNIQDLEREQKLLRKQSKKLEKEEFLSMESLLNTKKEKRKGQDVAGSVIDMLPISNPLIKLGLKILQGRLSGNSETKKKEKTTTSNTAPHKSKLRAIAFEFIGGYLKWKAIELSYKGIRSYLKKRKEKKTNEER